MKRMIAIFMAALMLTGVLTACGASVDMGTDRGSGTVSTTPDGTVNGGSGMNGNSGMFGGNGMSGRSDMNGRNSMTGGTGMAGGSGMNRAR